MISGHFEYFNTDRSNTLPGELSDFDHYVVYDLRQPEVETCGVKHRWPVFSGTRKEARVWLAAQGAEAI